MALLRPVLNRVVGAGSGATVGVILDVDNLTQCLVLERVPVEELASLEISIALSLVILDRWGNREFSSRLNAFRDGNWGRIRNWRGEDTERLEDEGGSYGGDDGELHFDMLKKVNLDEKRRNTLQVGFVDVFKVELLMVPKHHTLGMSFSLNSSTQPTLALLDN